MIKKIHEIRDPIHNFIYFDANEKLVIDSKPFQRLRYIHQLSLTYLVYPGATHKRFEHSLGVMELAGRVYDIVTNQRNIHKDIKEIIHEIEQEKNIKYWRNVLRMAELCHDLGHLPFSHGAEKELLPDGWNHERLTVEIIRTEEMRKIWKKMDPPLDIEHIVKLAVGEKELSKFEKKVSYTEWESILAEIITGDAFGVDRMDYLLRDSYHAGVAYGRFDHYRLIDTLRILPRKREEDNKIEALLGIEEGGLHSAEALLLARYFMFTQLYFHHVRRSYDILLKEFLKKYLPGGSFTTNVEEHLKFTDNEITAGFLKAARDAKDPAHDPARRMVNREHFRLLYEPNSKDRLINTEAAKAIYEAACTKFGEDAVRLDNYLSKETEAPKFPVIKRDEQIIWSVSESDILNKKLPILLLEYIFILQEKEEIAKKWLNENRESLIIPKKDG